MTKQFYKRVFSVKPGEEHDGFSIVPLGTRNYVREHQADCNAIVVFQTLEEAHKFKSDRLVDGHAVPVRTKTTDIIEANNKSTQLDRPVSVDNAPWPPPLANTLIRQWQPEGDNDQINSYDEEEIETPELAVDEKSMALLQSLRDFKAAKEAYQNLDSNIEGFLVAGLRSAGVSSHDAKVIALAWLAEYLPERV